MTQPKRYLFLKSTRGSTDGFTLREFNQGEVHELDESLAEQFYHDGAIEETAKTAGGHLHAAAPPAAEGEAGVKLSTQRIEELVSVARDTYGLDVNSTMDEATIRSMIEGAKGDEAQEEAPTEKEVEASAPEDKRETKVVVPEETKPAKPHGRKQQPAKRK